MALVLYKTDRSPPARAVLMTAEILGLKLETREVNTRAREQFKPEFIEKNPAHAVPVLEDGDFVLADSHAIMTYLVSKYGGKLGSTLYPDDLKTRARIDNRMYLEATLLFTHIKPIILTVFRDKAPGPTAEQIEQLHESYGYLEKYLERTTFLAADHITLADISVVSTLSALDGMVPVDAEKFPKVTAWWDKLKAKEWYQKVNVPGMTLLTNHIQGQMKENAEKS